MTSTRFASAAALSTLLHALAVALLLVVSLQVRRDLNMTPMVIEMMRGQAESSDVSPMVRMKIPTAPVRMSESPRPEILPPDGPTTSLTVTAKPLRPAAFTPTQPKPMPNQPASKPPSQALNSSSRNSTAASSTTVTPAPTSVPRVDTTWDFPSARSTNRPTVAASNNPGMATELEEYFAELRRRLRSAFEAPPGANDELVATVAILLSADGTISNPNIIESSGNAEFDRAVLAAIRRTRIRARPDRVTEVVTIPFTTHR